jgi:hypothetical protein
MRKALVVSLVTVASVLAALPVYSQQPATEDEAVKGVVEATTKAFWARDFET